MKKIFSLLPFFLLSGCADRSAIDVIGGADGPTAIITTSRPISHGAVIAGAAAILLLVILFAVRKR